MPKVKSEKSGNPERSNNSVRTKQTARKTQAVQKKKAPEDDKGNWGPLRVRAGQTIAQTKACQSYGLEVGELTELKSVKRPCTVYWGGKPHGLQMKLYQERDIEYRAWEKYGGPKGLEEMMATKEAKKVKSFTRPDEYSHIMPRIVHPGPSSVVGDGMPHESEPPASYTELRVKKALADRGREWLWKRLYEICKNYKRGSARDDMLHAATLWLHYPPRPTSPDPASPSFAALKEVLSQAPAHIDDYGETPDPPGLTTHQDMFTGSMHARWNKDYTDMLYPRLIDVIEDHGLEGWENARWLVYDKSVECNLAGPEKVHYPGEREVGYKGWQWFDLYGESWLGGKRHVNDYGYNPPRDKYLSALRDVGVDDEYVY